MDPLSGSAAAANRAVALAGMATFRARTSGRCAALPAAHPQIPGVVVRGLVCVKPGRGSGRSRRARCRPCRCGARFARTRACARTGKTRTGKTRTSGTPTSTTRTGHARPGLARPGHAGQGCRRARSGLRLYGNRPLHQPLPWPRGHRAHRQGCSIPAMEWFVVEEGLIVARRAARASAAIARQVTI